MAYVTLSDVKTYLGITDNSQDAKLQILIDSAEAITTRILGDLTLWAKTEQVTLCNFKLQCQGGYEISLKNQNVTQLTGINSLSYTGMINEDYRILPPKKSVLWIKDITTYVGNVLDKYFDIEYISGYATIPSDIQLMQYLLIGWLNAQQNGKEVQSMKVGDVSVTFAKDTATTDLATINGIIGGYKLYRL